MSSTGSGLFISLEGQDGCGKSSQVARIGALLKEAGFDVVQTREPGGTNLAENLRSLALTKPMDGLTEALLMFAARRDHIKQVIEPALKRGAAVVCDRFSDSTFAYQGAGRGFSWETLKQLEAWVQEGLKPDLTLWFDVSAEEAARRRTAARQADRFEAENIAFFKRVASGYQRRMTDEWERFSRINAEADMEAVWVDVAAAVKAAVRNKRGV